MKGNDNEIETSVLAVCRGMILPEFNLGIKPNSDIALLL